MIKGTNRDRIEFSKQWKRSPVKEGQVLVAGKDMGTYIPPPTLYTEALQVLRHMLRE